MMEQSAVPKNAQIFPYMANRLCGRGDGWVMGAAGGCDPCPDLYLKRPKTKPPEADPGRLLLSME